MLATRFLQLGRQQGATLIELFIGVVILGILLATGVPAFKVWMQNTKIRTATEAMQNGLQLARAEAVRRNERVRFVLGSGTNWTISTDSGTTLQSRLSSDGSANVIVTVTPSGATTVTFNSLGRVVANADGSTSVTQLVLDAPTGIISASQSRELWVTITSGGQIRTCDPNVTAAGDPRKC